MSEQLFVIMSVNYEYNDETYYKPESGGGHVQAAYRDLKAAQKELDAITVQCVREAGSLIEYVHDASCVEEYKDEIEALGISFDDVNNYTYGLKPLCDGYEDEQLLELTKLLDINFCEICQVSITE